MSQACNLLLSHNDYEKDVTEVDDGESSSKSAAAKSDYEQLLFLYDKCRKAAQVIDRLAPVPVAPSMPDSTSLSSGPVSRGPIAGKIQGPKVGMSKGKLHAQGQRMARVPNRTLSMAGKRSALQRQESDSSMDNPRRGASSVMKKARTGARSVSPVPPGSDAKKRNAPPPPSAQNFLAKLNNSGGNSTGNTTKSRKGKASPPPPSEKETPPTRSQPSRVQPSRSSRK